MSIVMNMSSYEIESDSAECGYSEEAMCAGWDTAVTLVCHQQLAPARKQMTMPADLATVDMELFLQKMYACRS